MTRIKQQIDSITGLPKQEGLQTLSSMLVHEDEHVSEGNCFISQHLSSATDTATTAADWSYDVVSRTTFKINTWFKYHTSGSPYGTIAAPSASTNYVTFNAAGSSGVTATHSGIYEKLTGLVIGFKYKISIRLQNYLTTGGTCTLMAYTNTFEKITEESFVLTDSPPTTKPAMILSTEFTAVSTGDIILVDFTNTFGTGHEPPVEASTMAVQEISVKRQDNYLIPSQSTDNNQNSSTIYKLNIESPVQDVEETVIVE